MTSDNSTYVYLDYAATAPLCEQAAAAMAPYMAPGPENIACNANPNSLHTPGRTAFSQMEKARRALAHALGAARPDEIIVTSGATEADNAALFGLAEGALHIRQLSGRKPACPHVITSALEHDAVLAPAKQLEVRGYKVTYLNPNASGFIEARALEAAIDDDTLLVSIQMANSEVGSIQPIAELARIAHHHGALFHTDAVQALGKTPLNLRDLDVDAASFSAHKIGGPKGVGALYLKTRTPFVPYLLGGGQENGRRSSTQNVAGLVGFAAACIEAQRCAEDEIVRLGVLRDRLYSVFSTMRGVQATVDVDAGSRDYLPNIVHVLFDDLESETLILRFDRLGFGVSGGSACSSHSLDPSHVLKAMGVPDDLAYGALRISMGRFTTTSDIDRFIEALGSVIAWEPC